MMDFDREAVVPVFLAIGLPLVAIAGANWVLGERRGPAMLHCAEPKVMEYTFHAKRIERDDNTYVITGKDGTVIRFEKSAYAYCFVVPDKEEK